MTWVGAPNPSIMKPPDEHHRLNATAIAGPYRFQISVMLLTV